MGEKWREEYFEGIRKNNKEAGRKAEKVGIWRLMGCRNMNAKSRRLLVARNIRESSKECFLREERSSIKAERDIKDSKEKMEVDKKDMKDTKKRRKK